MRKLLFSNDIERLLLILMINYYNYSFILSILNRRDLIRANDRALSLVEKGKEKNRIPRKENDASDRFNRPAPIILNHPT